MGYVNDSRHDLTSLADIVHMHGAFMVVNVIQSAGAMTVDVKEMTKTPLF